LTVWQWGLIAFAVLLLAYAGFLALLVLAGRREDARALARFPPDCIVLFRRLIGDPRTRRGDKLLLAALVAYLSMPFDLVPDFIPIAGQLDDAIVIVLVLRTVLRGASPDLIRAHWPGPEASLNTLLRLGGRSA